ncbi:DUF6978 family protein [Flavobacterium sp. RNTU_13]|uniref:DUF6978 family protein n=1 Tax=Flavobacterium sp. RNTU_13 TaxID=3375145 RepID=UPI00398628CE
MLTNEEANHLLNLEKFLKDPNQVIDLSLKKNSIDLISQKDALPSFRLEIITNQKVILKTTLHHLEDTNFTGLLRIDFKGGHRNPEELNHSVPEFLREYVGRWLDPNEPHIHYYVEGYRPLAWAIPISRTDFPVKTLENTTDLYDLIFNFAKMINIKSHLSLQQAIF